MLGQMVDTLVYGKRSMKKLAMVCISLFIFATTSVFADNHFVAVDKHVSAAVVNGEDGHTQILIKHVKAALEHALEASVMSKGLSKTHLDAAIKELQESLDLANLGHIGAATIHAEAADKHIKISEKIRLSKLPTVN